MSTWTVRRGAAKEYRRGDGQEFFSVSQVCTLLDPKYGKEEAMKRGQILHYRFAMAMGAQRQLCNYPPVIPRYAGWCQAMDAWIRARRPYPLKIEEQSCHPARGYAGQPDNESKLPTSFPNILVPVPVKTIIDLKTGQPAPTDPIQVVAYRRMEHYADAEQLLLLYIRDDGTSKEVFIPRKEWPLHEAAFLHALNVLRWRTTK
jgi:hypothetical protein